jgi:hypothetical protein
LYSKKNRGKQFTQTLFCDILITLWQFKSAR